MSSNRIDVCNAHLNEIVSHTKGIEHSWTREAIRTYVNKIRNELSQLQSELRKARRAQRRKAEDMNTEDLGQKRADEDMEVTEDAR